MPKIVDKFKPFLPGGALNLPMVGSNFVLKTMILIFSVPLISQSGITMDLKPLKQYIASRQAEPVDTEQLKIAVQTLGAAAQMNTGIVKASYVPGTTTPLQNSAGQDAQFAQMMGNLNKLTEQAP